MTDLLPGRAELGDAPTEVLPDYEIRTRPMRPDLATVPWPVIRRQVDETAEIRIPATIGVHEPFASPAEAWIGDLLHEPPALLPIVATTYAPPVSEVRKPFLGRGIHRAAWSWPAPTWRRAAALAAAVGALCLVVGVLLAGGVPALLVVTVQ